MAHPVKTLPTCGWNKARNKAFDTAGSHDPGTLADGQPGSE